jgi:hypothetical protein
MVIFFVYLLATGAILWYTIGYLPFAEQSQNTFSIGLNIVQWAGVSLLSFLTYRQEEHYRGIFFQMWVYFGALALAGPAIYHFYFWAVPYGGMIAYALIAHILYHVLFAWMISKVVFMYIFRDEKRWAVNVLSALVVLPLCFWLYWPYWWSPELVLTFDTTAREISNYKELEAASLWINVFCIALLLAFFLHKLKTDRPIGVYADTLLFFFILLAALESAEFVTKANDIKMWNISQWSYSVIAAAMSVTLLLRLKFKSQTIADYYESQCISDNPDIDRRIGFFDRLILRTFFDPEKIGQKVFLGVGNAKMRVRRTPTKVSRTHGAGNLS